MKEEDFPERIIPYDYDAYFSNPDRFVMVTTNCLTGEAEYFEDKSSARRNAVYNSTLELIEKKGISSSYAL